MDAMQQTSNEELAALKQHIDNLSKENRSLKQVNQLLLNIQIAC